MTSVEYKRICAVIIKNSVKGKFPGLKNGELLAVCRIAAVAIHARMYGANVDDVESPIWRDDPKFPHHEPKIDAKDLLNEASKMLKTLSKENERLLNET